ncbi:MAG: hypothetical protein U1F49_08270 [Rubrivivax sp.]
MNGSTSGRRPLIAAALAAALLAVAALAASCGGGGAGSAPDGGADAGAGSGAGSGDSGGGGGGSGGGGGGGQAPADPVASIDSPPAGTLFSAGETLTFAGSGSDAIDGTLSSNAFTWWVDLHHDTHTHPFRLPASGAAGTVTIPTRGETSDNVFYRFHLRATNSAGRAVEVTRDVLPRKAQVTLATVPSGLRLALEASRCWRRTPSPGSSVSNATSPPSTTPPAAAMALRRLEPRRRRQPGHRHAGGSHGLHRELH